MSRQLEAAAAAVYVRQRPCHNSGSVMTRCFYYVLLNDVRKRGLTFLLRFEMGYLFMIGKGKELDTFRIDIGTLQLFYNFRLLIEWQ